MGFIDKYFKKNKKENEIKYCVKCGNKLDKITKKCPYCAYNIKTEQNDNLKKTDIKNTKMHEEKINEEINFENIDYKSYQDYKDNKKQGIFNEEKEAQKGETPQQSQKRLEKEIKEISSSVSFINGQSKAAKTAPIQTAKSSSLRTIRHEILKKDNRDFETRGKQFMNCEGQSKKYIIMCGKIDYYKKEGKDLEKALKLCYEATNYLLYEEWGTDDKFAKAFLKGNPIMKNGNIIGCGAAAIEIKKIEKKISERTEYYQVYKRNNKRCKQGFNYVYEYFEDYKLKTLSSVDINKLEEKVKSKNLAWKIIE